MKIKVNMFDRWVRYFIGPRIGDVYRQKRPRFKNPFDTFQPSIVEVIDERKKWVQFRYESIDGRFSGITTEWNIKTFQFKFELIEKEVE